MSLNPAPLDDLVRRYDYLNLTEENIKSIGFRVIDFLMDNVTQDAIDAGMYHMPSYVGDAKFEEAFKATLWGLYEHHFERRNAEPAGPWVHIDHNGVHISKNRYPEIEGRNE